MKSRRPASAQWRSSNTRTTGPSAAIRSKYVRHAANRLSRPPGGAGSTASSASSAVSTHRRSPSSGTQSATESAIFAAGRRLVVRRQQTGPAADHLAERPERDAVAVGRRPPDVPVDVVDEAVEILLELPGDPALADARLARSRRRDAIRFSRAVAAYRSLSSRSSVSRPMNGASSVSLRLRPPRSATTRIARYAGTGLALPFRTCSPAGFEGDRLGSQCVRWPRRRGRFLAGPQTGADSRC